MRLNGVQVLVVLGSILGVCKAAIVQSDESGFRSIEDEQDDNEMQKRGLSVRGDLRALARMLSIQQDKRRQPFVNPSYQKLIDLGKRNEFSKSNDRKIALEQKARAFSSSIKRSRLSINGALHSLSDMLASNGRNRLSEEVSSNKHRLFGLGK